MVMPLTKPFKCHGVHCPGIIIRCSQKRGWAWLRPMPDLSPARFLPPPHLHAPTGAPENVPLPSRLSAHLLLKSVYAQPICTYSIIIFLLDTIKTLLLFFNISINGAEFFLHLTRSFPSLSKALWTSYPSLVSLKALLPLKVGINV